MRTDRVVTTSTDSSAIGSRSVAGASTKRQREVKPFASASAAQSSRSGFEISAKTTSWAPRSRAPKAMSPFPHPTSRRRSVGSSRALSSTRSRTCASCASSRASYSASPPVLRVRSQSAQMSVTREVSPGSRRRPGSGRSRASRRRGRRPSARRTAPCLPGCPWRRCRSRSARPRDSQPARRSRFRLGSSRSRRPLAQFRVASVVWAIVILVAVAVVALAIVVLYNRFVRLRNRVDNAWAQIEVQLKRRWHLIPNLVETVKGYAAHERETFENVTQARARAQQAQTPAETAQAEGILSQALGRLLAVAEAYPELQADENFRQLQTELAETENRIAISRQVYNDTVLTFNNSIQTVPGVFFAGFFGFSKREFFDVEDDAQREAPHVSFTPGTPAS